MECNRNRNQCRQGSGLDRPKRPAPPCMGNNCGCSGNIPIRPPQGPGSGRPPQGQWPGRPPQGPGRPPQEQWPGRPPQGPGSGRPPQGPWPGRPPWQSGNDWQQMSVLQTPSCGEEQIQPIRMYHQGTMNLSDFPVGMGYVPMQQWSQTYPISRGFERGTIFPELDLPFEMGRCTR